MRFALLTFLVSGITAQAQLNTKILHEDESDRGKVAIDTLTYDAPVEKRVDPYDISAKPAEWTGFGSPSSSGGGSFNAGGSSSGKSSSVAAFPTATGKTDEQRQREEDAAAQAAEQAAQQGAAERIAAANSQAAINQALADANRRATAAYQASITQQQQQAQQAAQAAQQPATGVRGVLGAVACAAGTKACYGRGMVTSTGGYGIVGTVTPTTNNSAAQYQTQFGRPGVNYNQVVSAQPGAAGTTTQQQQQTTQQQQQMQQQQAYQNQQVQQQIIQQQNQTIIQNVVTSIPRF